MDGNRMSEKQKNVIKNALKGNINPILTKSKPHRCDLLHLNQNRVERLMTGGKGITVVKGLGSEEVELHIIASFQDVDHL